VGLSWLVVEGDEPMKPERRAGLERGASIGKSVRLGKQTQSEVDSRPPLGDVVLDVGDEAFDRQVYLGGEAKQYATGFECIEAAETHEMAEAALVVRGETGELAPDRGGLGTGPGRDRGPWPRVSGEEAVGFGIGRVEAAVFIFADGDPGSAHCADFDADELPDEPAALTQSVFCIFRRERGKRPLPLRSELFGGWASDDG